MKKVLLEGGGWFLMVIGIAICCTPARVLNYLSCLGYERWIPPFFLLGFSLWFGGFLLILVGMEEK